MLNKIKKLLRRMTNLRQLQPHMIFFQMNKFVKLMIKIEQNMVKLRQTKAKGMTEDMPIKKIILIDIHLKKEDL